MDDGCITALITPFDKEGIFDQQGLEQLVDFQIENGITGILATGTTGESPTLKWQEHSRIIALIASQVRGKCVCIAGTGSNNTEEAMIGTSNAVKEGVDGVLLVDPYYNGPSSLEIRREYYEVVAKNFPDTEIIPYIIPGRSGTQLLPQDLAILSRKCSNITSVKEATGNLDNMKLTRKLCGDHFKIFSGDDGLTYKIMTDSDIKGCGSISVMSNIVPKFITMMASSINKGKIEAALEIEKKLTPLLNLVVVTTQEKSSMGQVNCRARNPLPLKTMMNILGMPSGSCRRPLGKMTRKGFDIILSAMQKVQVDNPEIFEPIASYFHIDIEDRLNNPSYHEELWYNYD